MTQRELKQAVRLLGDHVRHAEVIGISGGVALSVEYASDGEQKIFHTLREVQEHLEAVKQRCEVHEQCDGKFAVVQCGHIRNEALNREEAIRLAAELDGSSIQDVLVLEG